MHEKKQRARRARARGAVLVEAAMVFPLLVVFLGLSTFFHLAYREKIRLRSEARQVAFDAAIRGCPNGADGVEPSFTSGAAGTSLAQTAAQSSDGTSNPLSFTHGIAHASKTAPVSWNTAYGPWTTQLKPAESFVYCNELPVRGDSDSWFTWGTQQAKASSK